MLIIWLEFKSKIIKSGHFHSPTPAMSSYHKIISSFAQVGLSENSTASEAELIRALDNLARQRGIPEYDREVFDELWAETPKQGGSRVRVGDFASVVAKGEELVRTSISEIEKSVPYKSDEQEKQMAVKDIESYAVDLKYLTIPFGGAAPSSRYLDPNRVETLEPSVHDRSRNSGHSTVIFARDLAPSYSGSSTDLKIVFLLAVILTFLQIFAMFHKHHFYGLLAVLSVFGIFFLGYFDGAYMKFVKINLALSALSDLAWLFVNFNQYWNPYGETQHSSQQWAFLKFVILFVLGMMVLKIIVALILFKYRNNPANMSRTVSMCGAGFQLDAGKPSIISRIINGGRVDPNVQNSGRSNQFY